MSAAIRYLLIVEDRIFRMRKGIKIIFWKLILANLDLTYLRTLILFSQPSITHFSKENNLNYNKITLTSRKIALLRTVDHFTHKKKILFSFRQGTVRRITIRRD